MDEMTFRILDTLSRGLGSAISINELTKKVKEIYGTAYYKNIYDKIKNLERQKVLNLTKVGKASICSLNFNNYILIDLLAEMELKRKQDFLDRRMELQMLFLEMETYFKQDFYLIESISLASPEKNIKLNRAEFLFILREPPQMSDGEHTLQSEMEAIHAIMQELQKIQKKHNIKADYLILRGREFFELLETDESNPLKEMLSNKISFLSPQAFWARVKSAITRGIQIKTHKEINPAKISEQDVIYNLARSGYKEIGPEIKQGDLLCLEQIIISVLLQNDARRIEAIPILLAKNKPNCNLLIFLCQKYNKLEVLFGLLKALNKIKPSKEIENAIRILEKMEIKEEKADEKSIEQKLRLYYAI